MEALKRIKMPEESNEKRVGVRSLAKSTGLSVATISRVLNKSGIVKEKTREKVLKAIADAGYTPNSAARALATNRTRTIGVIVPTVSHSIFSRFLNAIEVELAKHGYALVIATTDFNPEIEVKRAGELLTLGAEGLILSGAAHNADLLSLIKASGVPVLCSSVDRTEIGLPAIGYDNSAIAYSAIEHLCSLGHREIAVVHGPSKNNDRTILRLNGVVSAAADHGAKMCFFPQPLSVEGGASAGRQIFTKDQQVTAILCLSDVIALGVLFEAQRFDLTIPDELSLMGFDDLDWAALSMPALTTIRLPTGRMGEAVAKAMVARLDQDEPIQSLKLEAKIVERDSTAPPPNDIS